MFFKSPSLKDLNLDPNLGKEQINRLTLFELLTVILKYVFAIIMFAFGVYLILKGVTSSSNIEFSFGEISFKINNTWPGMLLVILSIIVAIYTKLNITIKK